MSAVEVARILVSDAALAEIGRAALVARSGTVARMPSSLASKADWIASASDAPPPSRSRKVRTAAGRTTSSIAFFLRAPSSTTPSRRRRARRGEFVAPELVRVTERAAGPPQAVPHSGPLAPPPTVETSVPPAVASSRPGGTGPSTSPNFSTTPVKPRSMLVPWSASPIAASSWVR